MATEQINVAPSIDKAKNFLVFWYANSSNVGPRR